MSSTSTRPAEGPDTYVRKMLLDISERGRYLGLVLFSAQQFRSQVQRRVVGNAGTTLYGPDGHGRAGDAGIRHHVPRDQGQARDAAQGRADGAPPPFHPADLRPVSPAGGAVRARRRGAVPPAAELPFDEAVARRLRAARPPGSRPTPVRDAGRGAAGGRRPQGAQRRRSGLGPTRSRLSSQMLGRRIGGEVVTPRTSGSVPCRVGGDPYREACPAGAIASILARETRPSRGFPFGIRSHRQTPAGINQREADVANAFRAAVDGVIARATRRGDHRRRSLPCRAPDQSLHRLRVPAAAAAPRGAARRADHPRRREPRHAP